MTFVDTNVFVYAVGRPHPLQAPAREFLSQSQTAGDVLVTSAEVLQELLHIYLPVGRLQTLRDALDLVDASMAEVWPLEPDDVTLAASLPERHPALSARDLTHLACCTRRGGVPIKTFDRGLAAAFP